MGVFVMGRGNDSIYPWLGFPGNWSSRLTRRWTNGSHGAARLWALGIVAWNRGLGNAPVMLRSRTDEKDGAALGGSVWAADLGWENLGEGSAIATFRRECLRQHHP